MNLKTVIRSAKTNVDVGKWSVGHIPRTAFPLSKLKEKRYKFGSEYSWRLVKFECCRHKFRVLIILNVQKQILRARLGLESGNDMIVLSDFEFHASEPGWHCHVTLEQVARLAPGAARHEKKKWPKNSSKLVFGLDEAGALSAVANHYRFAAQGELL
jgi:hypothetical protein